MFILSLDNFFPRLFSENTLRKKNTTPAVSQDIEAFGNYLEVFLICDGLTKKERKGDFSHYFTKSYTLKGKNIFFHLPQALEHLSFLDEGQGIVKVSLPECLIKSHFGEFTVNTDLISLTAIHGCYPAWAKGKVYYPNIHYKAVKHLRKAPAPEEI